MSFTADTDDVLNTLGQWLAGGRPAAIATVVATWGSSPRPVGSQMAIDADGAMFGSVSGGCVEGAVVTEALMAIERGTPKLLEFGVANARAWEVGLACGGRIAIFVEPASMAAPVLSAIRAARGARLPLAVVTDLETGARWIAETVPQLAGGGARAIADTSLAAEAHRRLAEDRSGIVDRDGAKHFVHAFTPAPRLLVVGAVHIAQALAPMAAQAGWSVTVIDPREAFATEARFPGLTLIAGWPDDVLADLHVDAATAVVTLTHDPKIDEPALQAALASAALYVGALGSRKTHAARLERLRAAGLSEAQTRRIHAPIGIDIGAATPAEIAISILAEITAVRRGRAERARAGDEA